MERNAQMTEVPVIRKRRSVYTVFFPFSSSCQRAPLPPAAPTEKPPTWIQTEAVRA